MKNQINNNYDSFFGEVVFTYSRQQAIADGVLIDVTETAKEAGFQYATAVTFNAWNKCVAWNNDNEKAYQDESGRLWDILYMASLTAVHSSGNTILFDVYSIPSGQTEAVLTTLKLVAGPGDSAEPVLTIMLPEED